MSRILPLRAAVALCLVLLAAACTSGGSDGGRPAPDYTPVPDDQLYSKVAALPGVEKADLSFTDAVPDYAYVGEIDIAPDADAQLVLDTIYAILRQGRFDAAINIVGYQSNRAVKLDALPDAGGPDELRKRYGPQPGDGTPPGD